jgi:glutamyl-tRNA(Gln) amidotransferase subunit E
MYPDTDSAPIPISNESIEKLGKDLPPEICDRLTQLCDWNIPVDTYHYLLKRNLLPVIERIVEECDLSGRFVGTLLGHTFKMLEGRKPWTPGFSHSKIYGLTRFVKDHGLDKEILPIMLPVVYEHPNMVFESVLTTIDYRPATTNEIVDHIPVLKQKFKDVCTSSSPNACTDWIMGNLRNLALGNMPLADLRMIVDKEVANA